MPAPLPNLLPVGWRGDATTGNIGATASNSHRFLAKAPAPHRRVPSVPGFRKMRVQAARTFTDIGGSRGAEGKPGRSRPGGERLSQAQSIRRLSRRESCSPVEGEADTAIGECREAL